VKTDQSGADNNTVTDQADRPSDLPSNVDPTGARNRAGFNLWTLHAQPYVPAIDAQGNANCVAGQFGYLDRHWPGSVAGRYPPAPGSPDPDGNFNTWSSAHAGGSHVVIDNDPPLLYGPTFTGLRNLRDVP
jgi:hypothetical protein